MAWGFACCQVDMRCVDKSYLGNSSGVTRSDRVSNILFDFYLYLSFFVIYLSYPRPLPLLHN